MKRTINFAKRNFLEIIRDPLSIVFALVLPLILLFIFQQFQIPNDVYKIENFTPSIIIFGFSFITMFMATLIAKDRSTSLLIRLGTSPMRSYQYILGYTLAVLPLIVIQLILFYSLALILGLPFNMGIIYSFLLSIALSLIFIAIGIIIGSVSSVNGSAGIASGIVQVVAFTSGMWFSGDMIGGFFSVLCDVLPFEGCVNLIRGALNGVFIDLLLSVLVYVGWTVLITALSIILFKKKMVSDKK